MTMMMMTDVQFMCVGDRLNNLLENPQEDLLVARKKLTAVVSDAMSDGIMLPDLPLYSNSSLTPPQSEYGEERLSEGCPESKPLTSYSSRQHTSLGGTRPGSVDDNNETMTESMSALLSSYQQDIMMSGDDNKDASQQVFKEEPDHRETVVVEVPSVTQLSPEISPTPLVAPPPQVIAQQGPVQVPLTPFAFEGTVGMPNAPAPARAGESGYSQVLMELASR
jgi:hypothetical protein